ncbi:hypothetical protein VCR4J5_780030 [Vibrio crassostreae]|uniref:Uncharacterized protein n=1 Tax=Vibrio crassostreae TaxID=246167 RepID=A0A822MUT2_9VIBR|nr:hypothetical protein VCR9J2_100048 [Vibrio crassostreae]CDT30619.1 hypothetical protein VCR5J5_240144 [Vibrio crassostreae]CDT36290.1 hypothetical protein VCR19J5_230472 [Vibrio crassostreae]CDT66195.1 hypothetical protein VCR4J5_780030 [Vibrio crassostreae]
MVTVIDCMRVMASNAVKIAALKKQHQAVSRAINTRKGQHTADLRLSFCLIIFNPSHLSC